MTFFGWLVALATLLFLWRTFLWWPRPLRGVTRPPPRLIGHRGVRVGEPENSLAAFRAALSAGLDGVEFDVQRGRDGALVIFHDFELEGRAVASLSKDEISAYDSNIPTVGELFELARDYPGTLLNLEIKARGWRTGGLERAVVRFVRASGLESRVLLSSFSPLSLARVRLRAPGLRTALLTAPDLPRLLRSGWLAGWLHVDALHPHHSQVTRDLVSRAHQRGLMVNVWTVNENAEVARLLALDVDGVMADDPARLRAAAGRTSS